jgi:endoribonuclease Dicer
VIDPGSTASYVDGGLNAALSTATHFKLCAGGLVPWEDRNYNLYRSNEGNGHTALLNPLEEQLGYTFRYAKLLLEALCHPTFRHDDTPSYQRLEFLGDGMFIVLVDIVFSNYSSLRICI